MNDALLVVHGRAPQSDVLPQFKRVAIDGLGSPAAREAGVFLLHTRASGDALEATAGIILPTALQLATAGSGMLFRTAEHQ